MVSTQTSLTCSRNDDLLPQSLLYNIIASKLAEAFELTNLHAKICDYTDNLRSIKRETNQPTYQFTCNYPDKPHLDLVLPSDKEHQDPLNQGCFSPSTSIPRKRQRLHSDLSPASAVQETLGLRAPASFTCSNCKSTYKTLRGLNYHVKRCHNMVFDKPLTTACKQLSFEPDNPWFVTDGPVEKDAPHNNTHVEEVTEQSPDRDSKQLPDLKSEHGNVKFVSEQDIETDESGNEVMVAYLIDKHNSVKSEGVGKKKSECKNPSLKGTRSSNRVRSVTQRQIMSKLSLDRIKQEKRKTTASCSINGGAAQKTQKLVNTTVHSNKTNKSPAVSEKIPSKEVQAKRKKPSNDETVDLKRSVRQKQNNRINKKVEVCLKKSPNSIEEPADVKPYIKCKQCACSFKSPWNARRHEYTVHGIGTPLTSDDLASRQSGTECQECKGTSGNSSTTNIADESDTAWVCGVCGEKLHTKDTLIQHRKQHDKQCPPTPQGQGMFVCQVCFKKYESSVSLMNHVNRQHNPSLTCSLCYKIFASQVALSGHSCSSDVHISCRHCPKTFTSHSDHVKHVRNVHASLTHSLNQSACKLCDYTFSSALKYRVHQTIAHPTHNLLCQLCNTPQLSRDQLVEHVLMHHATPPFLCTVCEMGFDKQEDMTRHRLEHFK